MDSAFCSVNPFVDFALDVEQVIAHHGNRSLGLVLRIWPSLQRLDAIAIAIQKFPTSHQFLQQSFHQKHRLKDVFHSFSTKGMKTSEDTNRYNILKSKANVRKDIVETHH